MSYFHFPSYRYSQNKIDVELVLSNYATIYHDLLKQVI